VDNESPEIKVTNIKDKKKSKTDVNEDTDGTFVADDSEPEEYAPGL
jgi:hypothetical protein